MVDEWKEPSGHNCNKCGKALNKLEFKSAVGRDGSVLDNPSKAVCDSCCQDNENPNHRCAKCNKPFKYRGEKYIQITDSARAGDYHPNCWAEIEAEIENEGNNYHTCQECKKSIKAGEEFAKQTMPDAFSPHDVYYHKSCWEQKQSNDDSINTRRACSTCGHIGLPGACQICMARAMHGNHGNNNDDAERENRNSQSNKCQKCDWFFYLKPDGSGYDTRCHNTQCENYYLKQNNSSSKFKKGNCRQCFKSNVLIVEDGLCFKCVLTNLRLEWKDIIKKSKSEGISLKEIQSEWENTFKPQIEEMLRNT